MTRLSRKERLTIVTKLGVIELNHCQPCDKNENAQRRDACTDCPIYADIQAIGKELTSGEVIKLGRPGKSTKHVTVKKYNALKSTGLTDSLIAEKFGVSVKQIAVFKRNNGLSVRKPKKKQ